MKITVIEKKNATYKVKSCAPYAKGWQVNAIIDGEESEMTFYGHTRSESLEEAERIVKRNGKLPHNPYKG